MNSNERKKREELEDQLWQNRPLNLTKMQRLKDRSAQLIPLIGKNGVVERYVDSNAELTDHGRHIVYAMNFRPTAVRPDDYEAHIYFSRRTFFVSTTLIPETGEIVLGRDGEAYCFRRFDATNELEIFGVLKRVLCRLDQREN